MILAIAASAALIPAGRSFTCTATRVWDGDGPVWCAEGPRLRLAGIGAREIDGTCRPYQPCARPSGIASRDHLVKLLGGPRGMTREGHVRVRAKLACLSAGDGKGNRTAAWCTTAGGEDLSCAMVRDGFARRWAAFWRGHRCELQAGRIAMLTAFAWLLLAAVPEKPQDERVQAQASKAIADTQKPIAASPPKSIEQVEPPKHERPCREGEYDRNSELCAQWKAADAAEEAADWAARGFWMSIVGFLGLLGSLYYTRIAMKAATEANMDAGEALAVATRNADAATRQVRISEDTARRELRAYLTLIGFQVEGLVPGSIPHSAVIISNNGRTPARDFRLISSVGLCKISPAGIKASPRAIPLKFGNAPIKMGSIGPGVERVHRTRFAGWDDMSFQRMLSGEGTIIMSGYMTYRDVFGTRRYVTFAGFIDPAEIQNGRAGFANLGRSNKAS